NGTVSVLLNQPGAPGTFLAKQDYETCDMRGQCGAMNPQDLYVGPINADKSPDIAVVNATAPGVAGSVGVLFNNGGTFPRNATLYAASGNPTSIAAANLDTARGNDLVIAELNSMGNIGVLMNAGNGTFPQRQDVPTMFNGGAIAVAVGDVNIDG